MFQFDPQDDSKASEIIECPFGNYVLKPRGISHTFWNPTNEQIAYVEISTGTDFEIFVRNSVNVSSQDALEDEGSTYFEDLNVLAKLMLMHLIPNVKGMGGLYDAVSDLRATIEQAAAAMGIPVPPDLSDITID